jgi:hypothetical protein
MKMKLFPYLLAGLVCCSAWAQNAPEGSRLLEQAENRDMALSIPSVAVIEAIDEREQRVRIDGYWYRLRLDTSARSTQDSLSLDDLRPGQEVVFQTDGTAADRDNEPLIFRIWSN